MRLGFSPSYALAPISTLVRLRKGRTLTKAICRSAFAQPLVRLSRLFLEDISLPPFSPRSKNPDLWNLSPYAVKEKSKYIRAHFEKIETIFGGEANELQMLGRSEYERTKDHEDDSNYDYSYGDQLMEIESIYLRMHRYSAILTTYAYLETVMSSICCEVERRLNLLVGVSDLNGDGIQRCKVYLEKLGKFDFDLINPLWSRLTMLNKVRNCIMHANGDAAKVKSSGKFIKTIKASEGLSFAERTLIMVSKEFVLGAIKDVEELSTHLIGKLSSLQV